MSKSILLIDDDSISNYLVTLLVNSFEKSIPFSIATNVEDALQYLRGLNKTSKILILLDIHMPVTDGFEFLDYLDEVKEISKNLIEIVIISSSIALKDIEKAKIIGIKHFLVKPLNKEELEEIINKFENV